MRKTTTETYRSNGFGQWSLLPAMDVTSGAIERRRRKIYSPCGSASFDTQQITKFHITNKMKNRSSTSLVRRTAIILREGLNYSPSSERKQLSLPRWRRRVLKGSISTSFWVIFFLLLSLTAPSKARDITITVHQERASSIEIDGLNTAQRHGGYHVPDPVEYNVVPAPIAPAPRRRPVTLPPTFKPTFKPTSKPTTKPTSKPSIPQNPISPPTPKPSIARNPIPPQLSPEAPASPTSEENKKNSGSGSSSVVNKQEHAAVDNGKTAERWKDVTVPIDFLLHTIVTTPTTFDDVRILLEEMVLQDLLKWESTAYPDNIVKVAHVSLDPALAEGYNKGGRRRRLRVLQQSETVLRVTGFTVVKVDSDSINPEQAYNDINKELDENILVPDNIQSTLEPVGLQVTQVQNLSPPKTTSAAEEEKKTTSAVEEEKKAAYTGRIPSTTDIVFAILIIIVTSASLVFWARVLWKRRQKRLKKRRLNAIRRSQSAAVRDMMHSQKQYSQPNSNNDRNPPHGNRHNTDNESSSTGSGFQRFGPFEDSNENRMQDSFAAELREAATLDELAWSKGKPKNIRSPYYANVGNSTDRYRARIDSSDQQGIKTGARSKAHESGYGNYPIKSFPYGDEMDPPITAGSSPTPLRVMHLLSGDEKKDDSDVEVPTNFNDKNRLQQSLEKNLYLQESPILVGNNKTPQKSSISFGSQQKTKHLEGEKELRRSPKKGNKDDNEETKRTRSSLNASPMSSLMKNLMLFNKQSDDASENDSNDSDSQASVMTMEMLEEVKQLSQYMQRYEDRNNLGNEERHCSSEDKDDDMAPGNSFIKEAGLSLSATMGAARDLLYRHSNLTSGGEGKADFQDLKLRNTSYSEDDEDTPTTADSQRLGIKRSPNRPQSPKLIYLRKKTAILDGEIVDE